MSVFESELCRERNCVPPKRNTFSHAAKGPVFSGV